MQDCLNSFNIRQSEINFNAVMIVFELKGDQSQQVNTLLTLFRGEGIEVLSLEQRQLDAQEALFLRSRQLDKHEEQLSQLVNTGFDPQRKQKQTEINSAAQSQGIFAAAVRGDLAALDKHIRQRQHTIGKKATRFMATAPSKFKEKQKENVNTQNQADGDESDDDFEMIDQGLMTSVVPRAKDTWEMIGSLAMKSAAQNEKDQDHEYQGLLATILKNKEIAQMLIQNHLVVVIGSSSQQNLASKVKKEILPSFQSMVSKEEGFKLIYLSENKMHSIEDTVMFSPSLYKLQKSVILSEPSESMFK